MPFWIPLQAFWWLSKISGSVDIIKEPCLSSECLCVCLLGGPLNSYSTAGYFNVCRTITGLRQWRFSLTTIGGNTAAKKCVRNSPTDEPHERLEKKGNSSGGKGNVPLHMKCRCFCFFAFHSFSFTLSSLSSPVLSACLLSSLLFSLSLLVLAQPAYLNWAGLDTLTAQGGGPCLLSINNSRNSEIQVGPVPGRLYHTLEGGLPHSTNSLSASGFLSVFPQV